MKLKSEHYANIIAGVSLIVSVLALISSNRSAEDIAQRSGSFDKPLLSMSIGPFDIPNGYADTIELIYGGLLDSGSVNISSLPIKISNLGQKDAENISCIIQYPKASALTVKDVSSLKASGPSFLEVKRGISETENHIQASYQVAVLNPGLHVTVNDPLHLNLTLVKINELIRDSIRINTEVAYSMQLAITLSGKDLPSTSKIINLSCFRSESIQTLVAQDMRNKRNKQGRDYKAIYIYPEKKRYPTKIGNLEDFEVKKNSVYMVHVNDIVAGQPVIAALYDYKSELIKLLEFSENFKLNSVTDYNH